MKGILNTILSVLIIITLISCDNDTESNPTTKIKNTEVVDLEPTVIGLWSEGPHELDATIANPMQLKRVWDEFDIMELPVCNVTKLQDDFTPEEMQKYTFFHFKSDQYADIILAVSVPSIDYLCMAEGRADAEYLVEDDGDLLLESSGSFNRIGLLVLIDYMNMQLFTGPV